MTDAQNAPPNFHKEPVFVEIKSASYTLRVNLAPKRLSRPYADVTSTITFVTIGPNGGQPIIDLSYSDAIKKAWIDTLETGFERIDSPDHATAYLMFHQKVIPGRTHTLTLEHRLDLSQRANAAEICFFRMSHKKHYRSRLTDRLFLERYLPCNLEFDQHPMSLEVAVDKLPPGRTAAELIVYTNEALRSTNPWKIEYPRTFTASSPFFFLGWKKATDGTDLIEEEVFDHTPAAGGNTGTKVPVTIFKHRGHRVQLGAIRTQVESALDDLFGRFGEFPHHQRGLLLYADDYGIEYVGAAEVSGSNVYHELIHQYFGRCVMPADGNSGWIDEAIAHWAVSGYRKIATRPDRACDLGNRSQYDRTTHGQARSLGPLLLGHLDYRIDQASTGVSGLQDFLRGWVSSRAFESVTSQVLQNDLKDYVNARSLGQLASEIDDLFDTYVYKIRPL